MKSLYVYWCPCLSIYTFYVQFLSTNFHRFGAPSYMQPELQLASSLTHKKQLQPMGFLPAERCGQTSKHNSFKFNVQFPKKNLTWQGNIYCTLSKILCLLYFMFKMTCTHILLMTYFINTVNSPVHTGPQSGKALLSTVSWPNYMAGASNYSDTVST